MAIMGRHLLVMKSSPGFFSVVVFLLTVGSFLF
jgi:hypothetical protein